MNKFAATFGAATRIIDGPWAVYANSLLFKAGEYPDKGLSVSTDEVKAMAAAFTPGDGGGNVEHTDFLAGRAARIRKVWTDESGETLYGEVAIPFALDDLLTDDERRLSVEIKADKTLCGIALTTSPRVEEAVLMSAFNTFARHDTHDGQYKVQQLHDNACRHGAVCDKSNANMASRHEATAIQDVHDTCVKHGAKCASTTGGSSSYFDAGNGGKVHKMPTILQRLNAFFTKAGIDPAEEVDDVRFNAAIKSLAPEVTTEPAKNPEVEALRAELIKMSTSTRLHDAAVFAAKVVADRKALPKEEAGIAAAYFQAATDDAAYPAVVTFGKNTDGTAIQGTRVDQITALYANKTAHVLTEELLRESISTDETGVLALFNKTVTEQPGAEKPMTEQRKVSLMSMTPAGIDALKNGKGN